MPTRDDGNDAGSPIKPVRVSDPDPVRRLARIDRHDNPIKRNSLEQSRPHRASPSPNRDGKKRPSRQTPRRASPNVALSVYQRTARQARCYRQSTECRNQGREPIRPVKANRLCRARDTLALPRRRASMVRRTIPSARGALGEQMIKRIHVNQQIIRANTRHGFRDAPISVKTSRANHRAHRVTIQGPSELVYSPDRPLACGARLWIETQAQVVVYDDAVGAELEIP